MKSGNEMIDGTADKIASAFSDGLCFDVAFSSDS
jgi:hypothetical protein